MQPVVCMESRRSNTVEYKKYQDDHGLRQARESIPCANAYLRDLLDHDHADAVGKLNERIFHFARGRTGRAAFSRFRIDAFSAVLLDERLPELFQERRYPQMQREMERARRRPGPGLGR